MHSAHSYVYHLDQSDVGGWSYSNIVVIGTTEDRHPRNQSGILTFVFVLEKSTFPPQSVIRGLSLQSTVCSSESVRVTK